MTIQRIGFYCTLALIAFAVTGTSGAISIDENQVLFKNYSRFLNDVSDRRSRVVYTPYPVAPSRGVQQGFVHVSDGSVAFARTDLMVDAPMPLVLKRVYASTRITAGDFGRAGWGLSILETIERPTKDRVNYTYGNGRVLVARGAKPTLSAFDTATSDILTITVNHSAAVVTTRTGLTKIFRPFGNLYRLVNVTDAFGNFVALTYDDTGRIAKLLGPDDAFIEFARNDAGYIRSAMDHTGRTIHYRYDASGMLVAQDDLRGETWQYSYRPDLLLLTATTPNGLIDVALTYHSNGRVSASAINGFTHHFAYADEQTVVTDALGATIYRAASNGMTHYVKNAIGTETGIGTDSLGRPVSLSRNGEAIASLSYRGGAVGNQVRLMSGTIDAVPFSVSFDNLGRIVRTARDHDTLATVSGYTTGVTPGVVELPFEHRQLVVAHDVHGGLARLDLNDGTSWSFLREGSDWEISKGDFSALLRFDALGLLQSAVTGATGSTQHAIQYWYDNGGFRERTEASTGARVTYHYDASGSLFYTSTWYDGYPSEGFSYIPDEHNAVTEIRTTTGRSIKMSYNAVGLPHVLESAEFPDHVFHHDELGRLTRIDREGLDSIIYEYAPGEADIVLQYDTRSATAWSQHRDILEFGSRFDLWMSRIVPAYLGVFAFSESTREIELPFDIETWHPATWLQHTVTALRLDTLMNAEPDFGGFSLPSNRLFVPKELWSVNCCWCGCPGATPADCNLP